eukprot:1001625-Rhodomonas_salina.1
MTRVDDDGTRTWGAICHLGHWGQTCNPPRNFKADNYSCEVYQELCIPQGTPMSIRCTVKRKDFDWLLDNLPNWKSPGDDLIPNELLKAAP